MKADHVGLGIAVILASKRLGLDLVEWTCLLFRPTVEVDPTRNSA
jgi:hypothetical protein